jgi:hypothetical protein
MKQDIDHEWLGLAIHVLFARAGLGRNNLGLRPAAQCTARKATRSRVLNDADFVMSEQ